MASIRDRLLWRLRRHVYPCLGRFRPDLAIDPRLFQGFRDDKLQAIAEMVARTRFFHQLVGVESMISVRERQLLYGFGRWHPGPFLEIGPWVGMSTCHMTMGIRDSRQNKRFVTCELNPTVNNFRPSGGGIGFYYPPTSAENMGSCSIREYKEEIEPVISSPGGVLGALRRNLEKHGLDDMVEIHEGQFTGLSERGFRFIFIDAMHSPEEIARNAAALGPFLSPGTLLICHDLTCHPENERALRRSFAYGHTIAIDQMFIGEIV